MKKRINAFNKIRLRKIDSSKYNKFERTIPLKDISEEYIQEPTGWVRKVKK